MLPWCLEDSTIWSPGLNSTSGCRWCCGRWAWPSSGRPHISTVLWQQVCSVNLQLSCESTHLLPLSCFSPRWKHNFWLAEDTVQICCLVGSSLSKPPYCRLLLWWCCALAWWAQSGLAATCSTSWPAEASDARSVTRASTTAPSASSGPMPSSWVKHLS